MVEDNTKDTLYRYVGRQSKMCMRKGLSIVNQFYSKFSHHKEFIQTFSHDLFTEIIEDQLPLLSKNVSIVCVIVIVHL